MIFKDYFLVINKEPSPAFLLCFGAKILLVNVVKKLGCCYAVARVLEVVARAVARVPRMVAKCCHAVARVLLCGC